MEKSHDCRSWSRVPVTVESVCLTPARLIISLEAMEEVHLTQMDGVSPEMQDVRQVYRMSEVTAARPSCT